MERRAMRDRRRTALRAIAAALAAASTLAHATQPGKSWRVGFLSPRRRPAAFEADYYASFVRRLRELGYHEGRNIAIEWRFAAGDYDRLPAMAAELLREKVDVIVAAGPPGALAAKAATSVVPIVFVVSSDPVATGLVASLSRPGHNVTGIANLGGDLASKHVELMASVVPKLARIGVLLNPANAAHAAVRDSVEATAPARGLATLFGQARDAAGIERAFAEFRTANVGAVVVALDPLFIQQTPQIAALAQRHRLASVSSIREFAEAGGLVSYGQNQVEIYRRVADYVDRILKGTAPGDLPVQQPTRLELVINMKTARELGLAVPQSLLLSADGVID
jgi:putative ABC transport system substrate-binding protein